MGFSIFDFRRSEDGRKGISKVLEVVGRSFQGAVKGRWEFRRCGGRGQEFRSFVFCGQRTRTEVALNVA